MEFRVLGPLEVRVGQEVVPLGGPRPRALLGALLVHAGESVSVERLIDQVWGEQPPPSAHAALQMHVSALRRTLGTRLTTTASGYRLAADGHEVDAVRFENLIDGARLERTGSPVRSAAGYAAALSLWRGEPYGGVRAGSDVAAARHALCELYVSALEDRMDVELALGRHARVAPELAGLVIEHPGRSRLARCYLLALYRCGRIADAQAAYRAWSRRLTAEFGLEPTDDITALARAIERRDPILDPPSSIAVSPSRFVGRRRELEHLARCLGRARLLTLTGPGGSGKTRLALELAKDTSLDHPDGVYVIELAGLPTGRAVADQLAAALAIRPRPGEALVDTLAVHLHTRRVLVLLDNCEHLIDDCARLCAELLSRCTGLRILATSREPLGVPGERVRPLAGLTVPADGDPAGTSLHTDAVRLLADRGAAARAGFAVGPANIGAAARLCRLLDGLPLAIELAAAQLRTTPLRDLLAQLERGLDHGLTLADRRSRTTADRHRTMRAAIEWSHRLLEPAEQELFRRLSVFVGGCGEPAVEAVAGPGRREVLARLVDRSMLVVELGPEGVRYRMLELIRQYAVERLLESGEDAAVRSRHAVWCAELARTNAQFGGKDHADLVRLLDTEQANLRAAMEWCLGDGKVPDRALEIAGPLWWYWWTRGLMAEGRDWLTRALAATDPEPTLLRGSALRAAAALTRNSGDHAQARTLGEECLAVYTSLADPDGLISALGGLCVTALAQGDLPATLRFGRASAELAAQAGDRRRHASALNNMGLALRCQGRLAEADAAFAETLETWRALDDRRGEAATLGNLGIVARRSGNLADARRLSRESLRLYRELDLTEGVLDALEALAAVLVHEGRAEDGLRLLVVAERERARLGAPVFVQDEIADRQAAWTAARTALGRRADSVAAAASDLPLDVVADQALRG